MSLSKVFACDLGQKQQPIVWKKTFESTLEPAQNASGKDSDEVSESEILSIIKEVDRSRAYLDSFVHITFDWDKSCLSSFLMTDLSEQEREDYLDGDWDEAGDYLPDLSHTSQKLCKSTTSLHSFKTAFGDCPLTAGNRYFF